MAGTGNGLAKVYYDPVKSHRYVLLFCRHYVSLSLCLFFFFLIDSNLAKHLNYCHDILKSVVDQKQL